MKEEADHSSLSYSELFDAEMRLIVTYENEDFLRRFAQLIPEVISRSSWRVRKLEPTMFIRLYAALAHELAMCQEKFGDYRDCSIASICISLRLQRRLEQILRPRVLRPKKPAGPKKESLQGKPPFHRPRCVA
ncbi:hypothetical protein [Cerasicoccus maritimus]|uniref:hypothetical protein n=1 Tax=Cerasicoccus maritimus TaxID=490089 RepID=UPI002852AC8A|nr:hypothetical protein [Cerasicoccus maritimus]